MGQFITFTLALTAMINGFWYCVTQQDSMGESPVVIIPMVGFVVLVGFLIDFINENW